MIFTRACNRHVRLGYLTNIIRLFGRRYRSWRWLLDVKLVHIWLIEEIKVIICNMCSKHVTAKVTKQIVIIIVMSVVVVVVVFIVVYR